jgi:hypothetical protein
LLLVLLPPPLLSWLFGPAVAAALGTSSLAPPQLVLSLSSEDPATQRRTWLQSDRRYLTTCWALFEKLQPRVALPLGPWHEPSLQRQQPPRLLLQLLLLLLLQLLLLQLLLRQLLLRQLLLAPYY